MGFGIVGAFLATSPVTIKDTRVTGLEKQQTLEHSFHCYDLITPVSFGWSESRGQLVRPLITESVLCLEKQFSYKTLPLFLLLSSR